MGAKTYVSDDLVEGIAYTVTPDANMEKNDLSLISYYFYFLFTLLMVLTIRDSAQVHSVKG